MSTRTGSWRRHGSAARRREVAAASCLVLELAAGQRDAFGEPDQPAPARSDRPGRPTGERCCVTSIDEPLAAREPDRRPPWPGACLRAFVSPSCTTR